MGTNGRARARGTRAGTRDMYTKDFKTKGSPGLETYMTLYRVGDIVDIKTDPSIHDGMPFKCYHGKTGRVWNITPHAVGVVVNKQVRQRIIAKRLHIRVEHVHHSKSRVSFVQRVKANDAAKEAAKKEGRTISTKRLPTGLPVKAHYVKTKFNAPHFVHPIKYEFTA